MASQMMVFTEAKMGHQSDDKGRTQGKLSRK
jgi:hypothetical protein